MKPKFVAAMIGGAAAPFFVSLFMVLAEELAAFKQLMNLYPPVGPLSGKVLFGYLAGLAVCLLVRRALGERERKSPVAICIALIVLACLLLFLPIALKA